ncbi:acyltransferase family protein [Dermabacteraceae bacterium P9123]
MSNSSAGISRRNSRYQWMDALRGLAILLVVTLHVATLGKMDPSSIPVIAYMNAFFLPLRMPILMVLSGMLLAKSLTKSTVRYIDGKIAGILWPLFIWLSIWTLINAPSRGLESLLDVLDPVFWVSGSYLWYLGQLFALYLTALLFKKSRTWAPFIGFFLALNFAASTNWEYYANFFNTYLFFGIFLSVGYFLGWHLDGLIAFTEKKWTLVLCLPALLVGLAAASGRFEVDKSNFLWQLAIIIGVLSMIVFARHFSDLALARPLCWIGKNSIVFYVAHFPAEKIAAVMLKHLGGGISGGIQYGIILFFGMCIPVVLTLLRKYPLVEILFVGPKVCTLSGFLNKICVFRGRNSGEK